MKVVDAAGVPDAIDFDQMINGCRLVLLYLRPLMSSGITVIVGLSTLVEVMALFGSGEYCDLDVVDDYEDRYQM